MEEKIFVRCENGEIIKVDFLCHDVEYDFATEEEYNAQQARKKEEERKLFDAIAKRFENL